MYTYPVVLFFFVLCTLVFPSCQTSPPCNQPSERKHQLLSTFLAVETGFSTKFV